WIGFLALSGMADQDVDFGGLESDHLEVEVELQIGESLKLECQEVLVPPCKLGQLVVGDDERADLLRGEPVEANGGHCRQAELPGGPQTPVTGDDGSRRIDQERVRKPKRLDRIRNLANLLRGVGPRIPRPSLNRSDRARFN